jgi:hypothetical protein
VASPAQSAEALQRRTVKVSGLAAEPQLRPGRFSVQVVWQLEAMVDVQAPAIPPSTTSVPQQTVPAPHSSVPVFPVQSSAREVDVVHDAAHAPYMVPAEAQQWSPEGHCSTPASRVWHAGAVQTPAPVHATGQGDVVVCQVPAVLHVWGWSGPLHCCWPGAQTPVQVPPTQVWSLHVAPTTQAPVALQVSGWLAGVHAVEPAAHTPVQVPATQVELVHALPLFCHVPPDPQFWGCWPLHCV